MNTTAGNPEYTAGIVAALAAHKYDTQIVFDNVTDGSLIPIELERRGDISRPVPNTMTGICWQIADYIYIERVKLGTLQADGSVLLGDGSTILPVPLISEVLKIFESKVVGAKGPTARQALGYWVKFYGMEAMRDARVKAEGSAEDEAKKAAKAEKERIKAEKAAEKARFAAEKEAKAIEKLAADEGKLAAELERANKRAASLLAKQKAIEEAKKAAAKSAAAAAKQNAA